MTTTEFQTLLQRRDYDFLRTDKHLGENILFLTLGGSHAYGTNVEGSDCETTLAENYAGRFRGRSGGKRRRTHRGESLIFCTENIKHNKS